MSKTYAKHKRCNCDECRENRLHQQNLELAAYYDEYRNYIETKLSKANKKEDNE